MIAGPVVFAAGVLGPSVEQVVEAYLAMVDAELPELVAGLYLTGSVSLGDFRPERSDVDFVAVVSHSLDVPGLRRLRRVHRALARAPGPDMDGIYVGWHDLRRPATEAAGASANPGGAVELGERVANPVTWLNLASCAFVVRGPRPATLSIRTDARELRSWTLGNLRTYWRPWIARARRPGRLAVWTLRPDGVCWGVLGVIRAHYTLATGRIITKSASVEYARRVFGRRSDQILREALRVHADLPRSGAYPNPLQRRADALEFMTTVVEDAEHRFGGAG